MYHSYLSLCKIFFLPVVPCVLYHQLDSLEEERANLASECEELKLSLQHQKENAQEGNATPLRSTDSSVKTDPEGAGATKDPGTDSSSDTLRRLDCRKTPHLHVDTYIHMIYRRTITLTSH